MLVSEILLMVRSIFTVKQVIGRVYPPTVLHEFADYALFFPLVPD